MKERILSTIHALRHRVAGREPLRGSDPVFKNFNYAQYMGEAATGDYEWFFEKSRFWRNECQPVLSRAIQEKKTLPYEDLLESLVGKAYGEVMNSNRPRLLRHSEEVRARCSESLVSYQKQRFGTAAIGELKERGINLDDAALPVYVRFGHIVDYGPVADALLLVTRKLIDDGYLKYFKTIYETPRIKDTFSAPGIIVRGQIRTINIDNAYAKRNDFTRYSHHAPMVYLSNAKVESSMPCIVSAAQKVADPQNAVKSRIELEKLGPASDFVEGEPILEIIREYVQNLIDLEAKLDYFIAAKEELPSMS